MRTTKRKSQEKAFILRKKDFEKLNLLLEQICERNLELFSKYKEEEIAKAEVENLEDDPSLSAAKAKEKAKDFIDYYYKKKKLVGIAWLISCSDKTEISTGELKDVLKFENTDKRSIVALDASCSTDWFPGIEASIKFGDDWNGSVSYSISGNDKDVLFYSGEIETFIDSISEWFTILYITKNYLLGIFPLTLILTSLYSLGFLNPTFESNPLTLLGVLGFLFLSSVTGLFFKNAIFPWFLPKILFAINFGEKRAKRFESRRKNWSIGGIIVAVASGLIANSLTN